MSEKKDNPMSDLAKRVSRLENDMQVVKTDLKWLKKLVWRGHWLAISALIGIILTLIAVLLR